MNYDGLTGDSDPRAIFIAEAGINHNGNLETAKKMVDVAVEAEADYVKFQSFKAEKLVTPNALTSSYHEKGRRKGESFRDILSRLELSQDEQIALKKHCDSKNIKFLSTAFDTESFDLLLRLGIDVVKVASGELTNIPLLRYMARAKLPMVVSTGMATHDEIKEALDVIINEGNTKIILMHCISWYPAAINTVNLRYMYTLKRTFGFPVGYSDHTLGINMSICARAMGAVVLEKHFTLDTEQFGPDHAASIKPDELRSLVRGIRDVEAALGTTERRFGEEELAQRKVHRRSIVVSRPIKAGEVYSEDNIATKRPGTGIVPKYWDKIIGKKASRDLNPEHMLDWSDIV